MRCSPEQVAAAVAQTSLEHKLTSQKLLQSQNVNPCDNPQALARWCGCVSLGRAVSAPRRGGVRRMCDLGTEANASALVADPLLDKRLFAEARG